MRGEFCLVVLNRRLGNAQPFTLFGGGSCIVTNAASVPYFVARYNHSADWGPMTIAGLARQLAIDGPSMLGVN